MCILIIKFIKVNKDMIAERAFASTGGATASVVAAMTSITTHGIVEVAVYAAVGAVVGLGVREIWTMCKHKLQNRWRLK